jgi:lipopolysaccharide assembly outer membrane protein LptD (OstA)
MYRFAMIISITACIVIPGFVVSAAGMTFFSLQDTLAADTVTVLSADTTLFDITPPTPTGVDTVVVYSAADSVVYTVGTREMRLYSEGELQYRTMQLQAAHILFDWNKSELYAEGIKRDTVPDDLPTGRAMKKFYEGLPVMRDGSDEYEGHTIAYNFKSRRGRMTLTDTEIEQGHYHGNIVKKMDNDVLYLADGWYTTCSNPDHPHFYFFSPKMKVVPNKSVAASPIYVYIADVPVFVIPFGIFPSQSRRTSGLLTPTLGESPGRGRFLTGIGYYWAINDYMDTRMSADWYTKGGWKADASFRYALRYRFRGSIDASTSYRYEGEKGDPQRTESRDYQLFLRHNQEIDPTSRIDVNFNYMTSQYYQSTSLDFNQLLQQNIISNATYSKRWEGSGNNLSVNVNRNHNIRTDEVTWTLPTLSFSRTQSFPFRRAARDRRPGEEYRWYELIGYTYSTNAQNFVSTLIRPTADGDTARTTEYRMGARHTLGSTASQRVGYFNVTPFLNYIEYWYIEREQRYFNHEDSSVVREKEKGFFPVRHFNTGISVGTTIYGIYQPRLGRITGFRHTVTPSITMGFRPDFSKSWWGYYDTYFDPVRNEEIRYDRYTGQVYGSAPSGLEQSLSFSVGNLFEMKMAPTAADTSGQEKRYQLLNINFATSYNFALDSLNLSPISISFRTAIGNNFSISGGSSFDVYSFDRELGRRVNRLQVDETGSLVRFLDFNVNISTSLRGGTQYTSPYDYVFDDLLYPLNPYAAQMHYYEYLHRPIVSVPWDLSLSWSFGYGESNPLNISRRSNIRADGSVTITENWRLRGSTGYDFIRKEFTTPYIVISRDLHCWTFDFSWVPAGFNQHYRLEVRVKAPHLSDLKVTKRGSIRGVY